LDIGPLDKPFVRNPDARGLSIDTVDRWSPEDLKRLFPEIADAIVPAPAYVADVSVNGLSFAPDATYDFVICSHVVEHVANPFQLVHECHRVLREGEIFYISVPDGRYSDDAGRRLTDFDYLADLFRRGVTDIPDERVIDYLRSPRVYKGWVKEVFENNAVTQKILENEKLRSFHVHVWDSLSFADHFVRFSAMAGLNWRLFDLFLWENNLYEGVLILRKQAGAEPEEFRQAVANVCKERLRQDQKTTGGAVPPKLNKACAASGGPDRNVHAMPVEPRDTLGLNAVARCYSAQSRP
jgi:predicted SAM-dependent methyltransferase